jgi:hypothetical protein
MRANNLSHVLPCARRGVVAWSGFSPRVVVQRPRRLCGANIDCHPEVLRRICSRGRRSPAIARRCFGVPQHDIVGAHGTSKCALRQFVGCDLSHHFPARAEDGAMNRTLQKCCSRNRRPLQSQEDASGYLSMTLWAHTRRQNARALRQRRFGSLVQLPHAHRLDHPAL